MPTAPVQIIYGDEARPSPLQNQTTTSTLAVVIKEIFSNQTGNITKHQIIVTQFSDQNIDNVTNYWTGDSKQPYIAIECPHFFNSECPRPVLNSKRRRRSSDSKITIGVNGSCPRPSTEPCNAKLKPSTNYYVIYRACNEHDQCSYVMSQMMTTNGKYYFYFDLISKEVLDQRFTRLKVAHSPSLRPAIKFIT